MGLSKAQNQAVREREVTEQESLQLTRNLLRIAVYNISYIRGIFPESYFDDKYLPALDIKIKRLTPKDNDSQRLLEWMEKGVYDALQHKYLKTLVFGLCEADCGPLLEEYIFNFQYGRDMNDVSMEIGRTGVENSKRFKSFSKNTSAEMKNSACKMIRTLIQLMRTLDSLPNARTILMKLYYYDERTPVDYEPPLFRCCLPEEKLSWNKTPLKMKIGDVNSSHYAIALKVKSVLDSCDKDKEMLDVNSASHDTEFSSESDDSMLEDSNKTQVKDSNPSASQNQDNVSLKLDESYEKMKKWTLSRNTKTIELTDFLSFFTDVTYEKIRESIQWMVKEECIRYMGDDMYELIQAGQGIKSGDEEKMEDVHETKVRMDDAKEEESKKKEDLAMDEIYNKAVFHTLSAEYVSAIKLQNILSCEISSEAVKEMMERMTKEGIIEKGHLNRRRKVLKTESNALKLKQVASAMAKKGVFPEPSFEKNVSNRDTKMDDFRKDSVMKNVENERNGVIHHGMMHEEGIEENNFKNQGQSFFIQKDLEASSSLPPSAPVSLPNHLYPPTTSIPPNPPFNPSTEMTPSPHIMIPTTPTLNQSSIASPFSVKQTVSVIENASASASVNAKVASVTTHQFPIIDSQENMETSQTIRKSSIGKDYIVQRPEKRMRH